MLAIMPGVFDACVRDLQELRMVDTFVKIILIAWPMNIPTRPVTGLHNCIEVSHYNPRDTRILRTLLCKIVP
jgi:hypothetical protein